MNAKQFSKILREMARVPSQVSAKVAKDIAKEIQSQMDASEDPFGRKWKLKRNGKRSILKKTGRGRNSISVRAMSGAGLRITVVVMYMIYHQFGTSRGLPRRAFLPIKKLPPAWGEIVLQRLEEAYRRKINGK